LEVLTLNYFFCQWNVKRC